MKFIYLYNRSKHYFFSLIKRIFVLFCPHIYLWHDGRYISVAINDEIIYWPVYVNLVTGTVRYYKSIDGQWTSELIEYTGEFKVIDNITLSDNILDYFYRNNTFVFVKKIMVYFDPHVRLVGDGKGLTTCFLNGAAVQGCVHANTKKGFVVQRVPVYGPHGCHGFNFKKSFGDVTTKINVGGALNV